MIDWVMDTSKGDEAVWQSVNHTKLNSIGFEISTMVNVKWSMVNVSYSFIHQDKEQEPNVVSQYALEYLRHKFVANLQLPLTDRLSLNLNARWQDRVGSYTDFDGTVQNYRPYFLLDTRLTWQQPTWKIYLETTNLLDNRYHDYGLVEQPGRWLIAGLSISL